MVHLVHWIQDSNQKIWIFWHPYSVGGRSVSFGQEFLPQSVCRQPCRNYRSGHSRLTVWNRGTFCPIQSLYHQELDSAQCGHQTNDSISLSTAEEPSWEKFFVATNISMILLTYPMIFSVIQFCLELWNQMKNFSHCATPKTFFLDNGVATDWQNPPGNAFGSFRWLLGRGMWWISLWLSANLTK